MMDKKFCQIERFSFIGIVECLICVVYSKKEFFYTTSRSALGFMAHAGPQRRGIVREHFVAKGILKQKKVPSNIEYINLKCRLILITTQEAKSSVVAPK